MLSNSPQIIVIDVGHGSGAIVKQDKGVVVIDTGPKNTLIEFLVKEEISEIETILISHADEDHIADLLNIISSTAFHIRRVRLNTDAMRETKIWEDLVYLLDLRGDIDFASTLTIEDTSEFDTGDFHIEICAPGRYLALKGVGGKDRNGNRINANSLSAVIRVHHGGRPVALFTGDLDLIGLNEIKLKMADIRSPVLVFPHHGGGVGAVGAQERFTEDLLALTEPGVVIFSNGRGKYDLPLPVVVNAIAKSAKPPRIACTQLSKLCAADLPLRKPDHLVPMYSKGFEKNECCSGTIVLYCGENRIFPVPKDYKAFIEANASTALCLAN